MRDATSTSEACLLAADSSCAEKKERGQSKRIQCTQGIVDAIDLQCVTNLNESILCAQSDDLAQELVQQCIGLSGSVCEQCRDGLDQETWIQI